MNPEERERAMDRLAELDREIEEGRGWLDDEDEYEEHPRECVEYYVCRLEEKRADILATFPEVKFAPRLTATEGNERNKD